MKKTNTYVQINGETYGHAVYPSIYWIKEPYLDEIRPAAIENELLDYVAFQYNYWRVKHYNDEVYDQLLLLLGKTKEDHEDYFNPELVILQFGGIPIRGEDVGQTCTLVQNGFLKFPLTAYKEGYLFVGYDELNGLHIGQFEEYQNESGSKFVEYQPDSEGSQYFMTAEKHEQMNRYLCEIIRGINSVYFRYGIPLIDECEAFQ
jgi:hypothetical protein